MTGALGFGGPPDPEGAVMIGYSTYPGADRKGYASEATRALVEWALAQPGVTTGLRQHPARQLAGTSSGRESWDGGIRNGVGRGHRRSPALPYRAPMTSRES